MEKENSNIERNRFLTAKDLFFIAFHIYLLTQFYNVYGFNLIIWDGVQLILSSILVVGDPLFHTMQSFNLRNNWEDNLEPVVYHFMLLVTSCRAIFYRGSVLNFLAITIWVATRYIAQSDTLFGKLSLAESIFYHSIFRGSYLTVLCSILPVATLQNNRILFSYLPCLCHAISAFLFMTVWSFMVRF